MPSISRPPISHESSIFSEADTLASLRDKKEPGYPVVTVVPEWWDINSDSDLSDIDRLHRRKKNTRRLLWSALVIAIVTFLAIGYVPATFPTPIEANMTFKNMARCHVHCRKAASDAST